VKQKFHCTKNQMNVIHQLLKLARHETKIVYVLGNHDYEIEGFLEYDITIENIKVCVEYEYTTHDKKFILIHGDAFDLPIVRSLYILGDFGYNLILEINHWFNKIRKVFKLPYWSISQRIKHSVKNAVKFIEDYEKNLLKFCIHKNYDGIISGHIHKSKLERVDHKYIFNTGDWQESCTAIVEDFDGNFILLEYINNEFEEIKKIGVL
jgi:UDP-2,3-diacylglucosamine pyrophosphatase LpxH